MKLPRIRFLFILSNIVRTHSFHMCVSKHLIKSCSHMHVYNQVFYPTMIDRGKNKLQLETCFTLIVRS